MCYKNFMLSTWSRLPTRVLGVFIDINIFISYQAVKRDGHVHRSAAHQLQFYCS